MKEGWGEGWREEGREVRVRESERASVIEGESGELRERVRGEKESQCVIGRLGGQEGERRWEGGRDSEKEGRKGGRDREI